MSHRHGTVVASANRTVQSVMASAIRSTVAGRTTAATGSPGTNVCANVTMPPLRPPRRRGHARHPTRGVGDVLENRRLVPGRSNLFVERRGLHERNGQLGSVGEDEGHGLVGRAATGTHRHGRPMPWRRPQGCHGLSGDTRRRVGTPEVVGDHPDCAEHRGPTRMQQPWAGPDGERHGAGGRDIRAGRPGCAPWPRRTLAGPHEPRRRSEQRPTSRSAPTTTPPNDARRGSMRRRPRRRSHRRGMRRGVGARCRAIGRVDLDVGHPAGAEARSERPQGLAIEPVADSERADARLGRCCEPRTRDRGRWAVAHRHHRRRVRIRIRQQQTPVRVREQVVGLDPRRAVLRTEHGAEG